MGDNSGSVTLIFYRVGAKWWKEPALNLLAAAAQRSAYTHVELAIGEDALDDGSMTNVVRIFNDNVGAVSYALSNTRPWFALRSSSSRLSSLKHPSPSTRAPHPIFTNSIKRSLVGSFTFDRTFSRCHCGKRLAFFQHRF